MGIFENILIFLLTLVVNLIMGPVLTLIGVTSIGWQIVILVLIDIVIWFIAEYLFDEC